PNYPLTVEYYAELDGGAIGAAELITWSGYTSPSGQLAGYDIDQDNLQRFGMDWRQASDYALDYVGNDSFAAFDTSTPTETENGNTRTHNKDNQAHGTDDFHYHSEGSQGSLTVTWDCNSSDT